MDEIELAKSAVAGDKLALQRLLLANYKRLTDYIAPRIPPRMRRAIDAEDVVQEAAKCIHRDIGRFEPRGEGAFLGWAKSIGKKRLFDRIAAESCQKRGGDLKQLSAQFLSMSAADLLDLEPDSGLTPSRRVASREAVDELLKAIQRLNDDQRDAIQLYLDGNDVNAIAESLGKTGEAVRGLLYRAQRGLRADLGPTAKWFSQGDQQ